MAKNILFVFFFLGVLKPQVNSGSQQVAGFHGIAGEQVLAGFHGVKLDYRLA